MHKKMKIIIFPQYLLTQAFAMCVWRKALHQKERAKGRENLKLSGLGVTNVIDGIIVYVFVGKLVKVILSSVTFVSSV